MTKTPKDVGRHRRHPSRAPNGPASRHGLVPWLLRTLAALALLLSPAALNAQALKYLGTTPADGSSIESLAEIIVNFDFSSVIEKYGDNDAWGISYAGYEGDEDFPEQSVRVYKGDADTGELLAISYTGMCKPNNAAFEPGSSFKMSFPDIAIESGQKYTIVITESFFAGIKGEKKYKNDTEINFSDSPIILVLYGASETKKILLAEANSIDENSTYESIPEVRVSFNYEVVLTSDGTVHLYDGNDIVVEASSVKGDPEDPKSILVTFPETLLYNGHTYQVTIPQGAVAIAGEPDVVNSEVSVSINGASYRYFGAGRVSPKNGSTSVLDEICIPFKFPEIEEGVQYGFINISGKKYYLHVYEGSIADGEEVLTVATDEIGDDNQSLFFRPNYAFKPGTEYTFVIPECEIIAYMVGGGINNYRKDYLSERVELHYTTPTVEDLPKWTPTLVNLRDNDEVDEIKWVIFDSPEYLYDGAEYLPKFTTLEPTLSLYLVTAEGDQLITSKFVNRRNLTEDSEVGNGEFVGPYFYCEVNETLYEGNTYRVVWAENAYRINNAFIGQYVYNPEISVVLKGATPREDETEFVTIGLNIGDYASVAYRMVKGQESVLDVKPGSDWRLESLSLNGEDVTADVADNGLYTLPALEADATLDAVYAYAHEIAYDYDTAVGNIEAVPFRLASDGAAVVITGLQGGETIAVYTLGGMKVAALDAVPADMHRATLTLPVGQAYIILVDGVAVKFRH